MESPLQVIKKAYGKTLKLGDDDKLIVDCFVAVLTAAYHLGLDESVWMYFIGPPGSGKTESVMPMWGHPRCVMLTTPTENAFISGYSDEAGEDPSLILQLNGKVLIWKDFTALLGQGRRLVDKVFGEFRDAYDQYCSKASGKIGLREYKASFGMVACVTDEIDSFMEIHQQLGQRFLSFRINRLRLSHTQRVENLGQIVDAMEGKKDWKEWLRTTIQIQVDRIIRICEKGEIPKLFAGARQELMVLADILALARTVPSGETATRPELATRAIQQLINLGHAHAISDGRSKWNESDMQLIKRVILDSLSLVRQRLLLYLFGQGMHRPAVTVETLAQACRTVPSEIKRIVSQYVFSGLIEVSEGDRNNEPWYRLAPDIYRAIEKTGVLK